MVFNHITLHFFIAALSSSKSEIIPHDTFSCPMRFVHLKEYLPLSYLGGRGAKQNGTSYFLP